MKKTLIIALVAFASVASFACFHASAAEKTAISMAKPKGTTKEVTFSVPLHCENCVTKVKENISFLKGVKDLEVSLEKKIVRIVYDPSKITEEKLAEAIKKLGYTATKK